MRTRTLRWHSYSTDSIKSSKNTGAKGGSMGFGHKAHQAIWLHGGSSDSENISQKQARLITHPPEVAWLLPFNWPSERAEQFTGSTAFILLQQLAQGTSRSKGWQ